MTASLLRISSAVPDAISFAELQDVDHVADAEHETHVVIDEHDSSAPTRRARGASRRAGGCRPSEARGRLVEKSRSAPPASALAIVTSFRSPSDSSGGGPERAASAPRARGPRPPAPATAVGARQDQVAHERPPARGLGRDQQVLLIVNSSKSSTPWNGGRSDLARRCGGHFVIERPSSSIAPVERTRPLTASMKVVLPAPFGPMIPVRRPPSIASERRSTAVTPPKRTVSSRVTSCTSTQRPSRPWFPA